MVKRGVFLLLFVMFVGAVSAFSGAGDGSSGNPFQISNCSQLQEIKNDLGANYELVNNIDCSNTGSWNSGEGFNPIGSPLGAFTGILDGKNYNITDLGIARGDNHVGLFGYVLNSVIKNTNLLSAVVSGSGNVGGLAGTSIGSSIIDNHISGTIKAAGTVSSVGGLIGEMDYGNITNSSTNANVYGRYYVGGLVGFVAKPVNISSSFSNGSVKGIVDEVGGLVGYNYGEDTLIINCYSSANVTGSDDVGGLAGVMVGGNITNSYASGNVVGTAAYSNGTAMVGYSDAGGLVGGLFGADMANSFSTGDVGGSYPGGNIGGLIGWNSGGKIENSYYYNSTGNPDDCVGRDDEITTCTAETTVSYFYNSGNEPMLNWDVGIWYFSGASFPTLLFEQFGFGGTEQSSMTIPVFVLSPEKSSFEAEMSSGESMLFNVEDEEHTLTAENIEEDSANLTISSDPINFILRVGKNKKLDIDGDGIRDIVIKLGGINEGVAELFIKSTSDKLKKKDEIKLAIKEIKEIKAKKIGFKGSERRDIKAKIRILRKEIRELRGVRKRL